MIKRIMAYTLPGAYHKALTELYYNGEERYNEAWKQKRKELQAWIEIYSPTEEPRISKLGIYDTRALQKYEMELVDGIEDFEVGVNWTYTYHQRLATQIDKAVSILLNDPGSTRAVLTIRDEDDIYMEDSPCMQSIQFMINHDKLDMYVMFRSNDLVKATFMNMWGLIKLQEKVARRLNKPVGVYNHIVTSLHCYEEDYALLKGYMNALKKNPMGNKISYEDDWRELMEDEVPGILEEIEVLKERASGKT